MKISVIRIGLVAVLLHGLLGVTSQAQTAADERPTFRSSADLVTIQASVRNRKGRVVKGLRPGDFEVRDNGELRPVLSLRSDNRSPLSVALVVDTSGSMAAGRKLGLVRGAFDAVLAHLRPGEDEAAVFTFDAELHERRSFTSDLSNVAGALDGLEPFGWTSLYDAAAAAARRLAERTAAHKAIVVLTDGTDTTSALTASDVSALASSIGVPVYVVATVLPVDRRAMAEGEGQTRSANAADLRSLAEWTGGMLLFASDPVEIRDAAFRLIDELRHHYVIAIEAAAVPQWRRLEIRVKRSATMVKARTGYFGG